MKLVAMSVIMNTVTKIVTVKMRNVVNTVTVKDIIIDIDMALDTTKIYF